VESLRIEIGTVWPNQGVCFRIELNLGEQTPVLQWPKHLAGENPSEINSTLEAVVEFYVQHGVTDNAKSNNPV
jgi:hypothetical protein